MRKNRNVGKFTHKFCFCYHGAKDFNRKDLNTAMEQKEKEQRRPFGKERCMFCGRDQEGCLEINTRDGKTYCLCGDCLEVLYGYYRQEHRKQPAETIPTPRQIREELDRRVIGQEEAKKILSVAAYNHFKRRRLGQNAKKSNILLCGPSGSGKTLLAKALADCLNVPFVIADATSFTEAGYIGADVESCIEALLKKAGGDVRAAEHGIVYVDEIDKIAKKGGAPGNGRDISGEGVQNALLKLMEGTTVQVRSGTARMLAQERKTAVKTDQILFICGGAFAGIDEPEEKPAGFLATREPRKPKQHRAEDFIRYGMTPELMGRLPVIASLSELTSRDLVRVLTEPEGCLIEHYQDLLELDGVALTFTDEALEGIARKASENGTGARGLQTVMEDLMLDIMYQAPEEEAPCVYRITESSIRTHLPEITLLEELQEQMTEG